MAVVVAEDGLSNVHKKFKKTNFQRVLRFLVFLLLVVLKDCELIFENYFGSFSSKRFSQGVEQKSLFF